MSAWQPIESAKPADGKSVLVATADEPPVVGEAWWRQDYNEKLELWWAGTGPGDYHADPISQSNRPVTHWMPLPAPPAESGLSGRTGSEAYTAEGKETRDDLNYTQPSDATELVGAMKADAALIRVWDRFELSGPAPARLDYSAVAKRIDQAADFITQAQARATAAEGEMPSREEIAEAVKGWKLPAGRVAPGIRRAWNDALAVADAILALRKPSSAEARANRAEALLGEAVKVLEANREVLRQVSVKRRNIGPLATASLQASWQVTIFLSSLSHQDEQG